MEWIKDRKPDQRGYYLAAWNDEGHWRVSELWFEADDIGSGWWPTRGYMARFVGDQKKPARSLTVAGWAPMPEYPGPGKIIAYLWREADRVFDPKDLEVVRQGVTLD
jgi:hypothetical protein